MARVKVRSLQELEDDTGIGLMKEASGAGNPIFVCEELHMKSRMLFLVILSRKYRFKFTFQHSRMSKKGILEYPK